MACAKNGIFEHINVPDELLYKMSSYTSLIARGIEIKEPVWVEPYEDASGLGVITTVSMPIYDRS